MGFKNVLANVSKSISTKMGMAGLKLSEKKPEILLVCGIVTMGGAVVTAIVAARKHDEILEQHLSELEVAKAEVVVVEAAQNEENVGAESSEGHEGANDSKAPDLVRTRTEEEIKKDVRKVYIRTGCRFVKLYAPTVAFMGISTACFIGMHNIQAGRIAGLSGAYTGLKTAFDEYQQRNIELNGEENHRMCKYGYKEVEREEEDPDTGEVTKVKEKVPLDAHEVAEAEREAAQNNVPRCRYVLFDKHCGQFDGDNNIDLRTLLIAQDDLRNLVRARGWAIENDLRDLLGTERTVEGARLGWVKGMGPDPDLGIKASINRQFINGHKYDEVILELNIHGDITSLIKMKEMAEKAAKADGLPGGRVSGNVNDSGMVAGDIRISDEAVMA